jgi:hypothetical protein
MSTWEEAGCNWGYWTEWNEEWYQRHTRNLRDGKAEPLPASKWYDKLKRWKGSRMIVSKNEKYSQAFLNSHR